MSMAPCFADTNNLAVDPARTAEDTQHTLQSILSHTDAGFCSLSVFPSVLLPLSLNLSFLSFTFLSPLSFSYLLPLCYQRCNLYVFYPNHFLSLHLKPLIRPLPLSIIHCLSQSMSLCLSFSAFHPSFPSPSISQPSQQLHCPWVRVNNVSPHWAPVQSQLRRQGAPENTHNSMFQLGCRIKGSLTHGWLCGSTLDHL